MGFLRAGVGVFATGVAGFDAVATGLDLPVGAFLAGAFFPLAVAFDFVLAADLGLAFVFAVARAEDFAAPRDADALRAVAAALDFVFALVLAGALALAFFAGFFLVVCLLNDASKLPWTLQSHCLAALRGRREPHGAAAGPSQEFLPSS